MKFDTFLMPEHINRQSRREALGGEPRLRPPGTPRITRPDPRGQAGQTCRAELHEPREPRQPQRARCIGHRAIKLAKDWIWWKGTELKFCISFSEFFNIFLVEVLNRRADNRSSQLGLVLDKRNL